MSDHIKTTEFAEILSANPGADYQSHKELIDEAINRVLESGRYILGEEVNAFEEEFADYLGAEYAVGVGSATEALHLALRVLGIGSGDTVFTVSHTAVATVAAIELSGAIPNFVDIDLETYTMDPLQLELEILKAIHCGARVRAVIPVHLYGHPAEMPVIMEIARRYGLFVIEDCAQSSGSMIKGKMTGTWGDLAAFSFYPTKNLGALGDGGALVTNEAGLAEKAQSLRQYGWSKRYISEIPGMNTRLDEIQASILRVKLRALDDSNERRRLLAAMYDTLLADSPLKLPMISFDSIHVFHQYVVRSKHRDDLRSYLQENGVSALIHYPMPIHLQPAYQKIYGGVGAFPITEQSSCEVLSLPLHPGSTCQEVERVADLVVRWHSRNNRLM